MKDPKQVKSYIVANTDIGEGEGGGLDETAVNALIVKALANYAKTADMTTAITNATKDLAPKSTVYTKAEADAKFAPKV